MASSSLLLLLLLSLYLSLFASTSKAAESILLSEPITSNGPETLLICIPGMSVPATEYVPSCLAIQNNLPFRTWVAVMSFRGNVVNPASIEKGFDMAIEAVQKAGFSNVTNSDIFVWAHSAGGPFSADLVAARQYSGFILYGSYITSYPLLEYPVPFISVGGELDGLAQTSRVAEDYRVCRDLIRAGKREEAVSRKAVVVAEGMNHALMCNNYIQGLIAEEDFEAEITLEQALADIGRVSAAFIQIHRTQGLNGPAYQLISDLIDFSDQVFGGFLEAQDDDKGVWCTRTQTLVANLNDPSLHNLVNVEEPDFDAFVDSKASLTVTNGIAYITTHSFQNFSRISGEVGVYSEGETALEVGCKMKSQDSILDKLKNPAHGVAGTCKEAHNAMIDLALKRVSPSIRERYALKGRQLLFLEDVLQSRGDLWVDSHLIFDDSVTPVEVTASRLYSANIPTEFGGATYCKMLSAAKVFSWIMHDSLPRGLSMK